MFMCSFTYLLHQNDFHTGSKSSSGPLLLLHYGVLELELRPGETGCKRPVVVLWFYSGAILGSGLVHSSLHPDPELLCSTALKTFFPWPLLFPVTFHLLLQHLFPTSCYCLLAQEVRPIKTGRKKTPQRLAPSVWDEEVVGV